MAEVDLGAHELVDFVRASHLALPDDVPGLVAKHARAMGFDDAALYIVDYEQRVLIPVPKRGGRARDEVAIDATLAGRCYRTLDIQQTTWSALSPPCLPNWIWRRASCSVSGEPEPEPAALVPPGEEEARHERGREADGARPAEVAGGGESHDGGEVHRDAEEEEVPPELSKLGVPEVGGDA